MPSQFRDVPWKRNINKIPDKVRRFLQDKPDGKFVVGSAKVIPTVDLDRDFYGHLGIGRAAGNLIFPESKVPLGEMGKYSLRNREGWVVKRDDLPMVTKTRSFDSPNWGDPSNGWHTVEWDQDVYQRDYFDPTNFAIRIECLKQNADAIVMRFVVDWPINRTDDDFEDNLLFALNLLQENVGCCGILPSDISTAALLASVEMSWEFFPPGTAAEVERFFIGGLKRPSPELELIIKERTALFRSLKPRKYLLGVGGMNRYVGAMFADDLVVFENVRYGNALYVLDENWQKTSKRSRIDLLKDRDGSFVRFVHQDGWKARLLKHIKAEKKKRGIKDEPDSKESAA